MKQAPTYTKIPGLNFSLVIIPGLAELRRDPPWFECRFLSPVKDVFRLLRSLFYDTIVSLLGFKRGDCYKKNPSKMSNREHLDTFHFIGSRVL